MKPRLEINLVHELGFKRKPQPHYVMRKFFLRSWVVVFIFALGSLFYYKFGAISDVVQKNLLVGNSFVIQNPTLLGKSWLKIVPV